MPSPSPVVALGSQLRQETDNISLLSSRSDRIDCTRAFFLSPPGSMTRRVIDYQGKLIYRYGVEQNIDSPGTVACKDSKGNVLWSYPLARRMWCDLAPVDDGRLCMRVFDISSGGNPRASLIVMETTSGTMAEVPSAETAVPPYKFFWLGQSRFAHVYHGHLEIWTIDEKLRKIQSFNFGASLDGFQVHSLNPEHISIVHHNSSDLPPVIRA